MSRYIVCHRNIAIKYDECRNMVRVFNFSQDSALWRENSHLLKKTYQFTIYYVALSFITKGWYVIETLRRNKVHGMWKWLNIKLFIEMIFGYFSKNCLRQKPLTTSTWVLIGCDEHSHCMAVTFTFSLKEKAKSQS